ncbi:MAG TPA: hypothetical protein VGE42_09345 [Candidatus Dormibacteraeota bacterium]
MAEIIDVSLTVDASSGTVIQDLRICPGCGRPESRWREHAGSGFTLDSEVYCCRGCADQIGCTCGP